MRIAVFGLGYVGLVAAVCHAASGHKVVGVETDVAKLASLRHGVPPISEPRLSHLLERGMADGNIELTSDGRRAVADTEYALVCVGTPTGKAGDADLSAVLEVMGEIGTAIIDRELPYNVVLRSTVPPGTTRTHVWPLLDSISGKRMDLDVRLYYNPEFLRQGSAVADFNSPPFIVFGTCDGTLKRRDGIGEIYREVNCDRVVLSYEEAELLKLACNAFHAFKIDFANEIGTVAQAVNADPGRVMSALSLDTKLNVSPAYLRPGFAFGGSCLPKDVRALDFLAREQQLALPLISAIIPSNDAHLQREVERLCAMDADTIGVIGITFKPNTDDLRESAALRLVRKLGELGKDVVVYEPHLMAEPGRLLNLEKLETVLPDYANMIVDWKTLLKRARVLVLTRHDAVSARHLLEVNRPVIDVTQLRSGSVSVAGP